MPVNPELGRQRREDQEFKVFLNNISSMRLSWATLDCLRSRQNETKQTKIKRKKGEGNTNPDSKVFHSYRALSLMKRTIDNLNLGGLDISVVSECYNNWL